MKVKSMNEEDRAILVDLTDAVRDLKEDKKSVESILNVKKNWRTHIARDLFKAIGVEPGETVKIRIWKIE